MQWERGHRSDDVEDRRGAMGSGNVGLLFGLFRIFASFGIPGVIAFVVLLVCAGLFFGTSNLLGTGTPVTAQSPAADEQVQFVSFVLDDTQAYWSRELTASGTRYDPARLVLYTGSTTTSCGYGSAASGPFYCPADETVYLDLSFNDELAERFGAPGDFAQAYVIGHEIGHHVQHELGLGDAARGEGAGSGSVRFELQADCFAGIWAASIKERGLLDPGDTAEALRAASAIGDDRLQRQAQGTVTPDSFTHGTSAQRMHWFQVGYSQHSVEKCDTFSTGQL